MNERQQMTVRNLIGFLEKCSQEDKVFCAPNDKTIEIEDGNDPWPETLELIPCYIVSAYDGEIVIGFEGKEGGEKI